MTAPDKRVGMVSGAKPIGGIAVIGVSELK